MATQQELAIIFKDLHIKGDPIILYNVWDAGSAKTVAGEGAKAIALSSHAVANAFGYEDGQNIPLELVASNAKRVVHEVEDIPVTLDFETGYGQTPDEVKRSVLTALQQGIVGVNIEDQIFDTTDLVPLDEQVARLQAARSAASDAGVDLFINARTDLFKNTPPEQHDEALLDRALERAFAFSGAGASGFFLPGIVDSNLINILAEKSPLPVNIVAIPGAPSNRELADAGVARISYGPIPYLQMVEWLKSNAKQALHSA